MKAIYFELLNPHPLSSALFLKKYHFLNRVTFMNKLEICYGWNTKTKRRAELLSASLIWSSFCRATTKSDRSGGVSLPFYHLPSGEFQLTFASKALRNNKKDHNWPPSHGEGGEEKVQRNNLTLVATLGLIHKLTLRGRDHFIVLYMFQTGLHPGKF